MRTVYLKYAQQSKVNVEQSKRQCSNSLAKFCAHTMSSASRGEVLTTTAEF
jgi:hypothetical protein